jgi:hypothetical protein
VNPPRSRRIEWNLPPLTPAQADLLWGFVQDLASKLWEVYESELLSEVEDLHACPTDLDGPDSTGSTANDDVPFQTSCARGPPAANNEPDSDLPLHPRPDVP